ncbi:MAG: site-specific integrase [Selenomonadaceae bacterium]|nr:site-specific integrase [Selenomonadaceae bacterium]
MSAYKDEKHGTWYVKFSYVDWKGNTRWTTKRGFKGKRAAEKYEREFKDKAKSTPDMTVRSLVELYLADAKLHIRESTYILRKRDLMNHVVPSLGDLKLSELTPLKMRKWQSELVTSKSARTNRALSPATIQQIRTVFSIVLNYAIRFYGLSENPLRIAGKVNSGESTITRKSSIWTQDDFNKAIQYEERLDVRLVYYLLFFGGFRIGEVLALNVSDFDFMSNVIHITKSYSSNSGKITATKTNSSVRDVTMPVSIMDMVHDYISRLEPVLSPVFSSVSISIVERHIRQLAAAAGVPRIRVHDLRHSHASYLINHNVPITAISHRLGHKNANVTLSVYSHFYKSSDKSIADMLAKSLSSL